MIHEAGPVVRQVQKCVRCDYVLQDYSHLPVDAAVKPWPTGTLVEIRKVGPKQRTQFQARTEKAATCEVR